jgi:hypothetical protein
MGTKRIFIAGHGMMLKEGEQIQTFTCQKNVFFYVEEDTMLDITFIPGIIQIVNKLNRPTNIEKLKAWYLNLTMNTRKPDERATGHSIDIKNGSIPNHLLYIKDKSYPPSYNPYYWYNFPELWNKGKRDGLPISIVGGAKPFLTAEDDCINGKWKIKVCKGNEKFGLSEDDILIYPSDIITSTSDDEGNPTPTTYQNYLTLEKIMDWAIEKFGQDEVEFHWLACRSILPISS